MLEVTRDERGSEEVAVRKHPMSGGTPRSDTTIAWNCEWQVSTFDSHLPVEHCFENDDRIGENPREAHTNCE